MVPCSSDGQPRVTLFTLRMASRLEPYSRYVYAPRSCTHHTSPITTACTRGVPAFRNSFNGYGGVSVGAERPIQNKTNHGIILLLLVDLSPGTIHSPVSCLRVTLLLCQQAGPPSSPSLWHERVMTQVSTAHARLPLHAHGDIS